MLWDVEKRAQRAEAMTQLQRRGLRCRIPPRRLGDRFTFQVSNVPDHRREEVEAAVLEIAPNATLQR